MGIFIRILVLYLDRRDGIDMSDTSALVAVLMKAPNLRHAHVEAPFATTALTVMSDTCRAGLQCLNLTVPISSIPTILTYAATFSHLEHLVINIYPGEIAGPPEVSDATPWAMNRLRSIRLLSNTSPPPLALIHFLAKCSFPIIQALHIDVDVTGKHEARALSKLVSSFALLRVDLVLVRKYHQYVLPQVRATTLSISDTPQSTDYLSKDIKEIHMKSPTSHEDAFAFFVTCLRLRPLCRVST
jgi:hypothetical protein